MIPLVSAAKMKPLLSQPAFVGQVVNLRPIVNRPRVVGQAILPAAAFQAALVGQARAFAPGESRLNMGESRLNVGESRLKAGCSQDCLPHNLTSVAR
jgi:hypothetical protein